MSRIAEIIKYEGDNIDTLVSGSPIIQDGKLIGAVPHVLVNDPTKGYAIFAENMLETAQGAAVFDTLDDIGYSGTYSCELRLKLFGSKLEEFLGFAGDYIRKFVENHGKI